MREMRESLRIEIIHGVRSTVMIQSCSLGNNNRVFLATEILAKGVGVDALDVWLFSLVVCRHGEEEVAGGGGELVDGQFHEWCVVGWVLSRGFVGCVVMEDGNGGMDFDEVSSFDGTACNHA